MPVKVAIVGAGSIGFTCGLMKDTLSVPELRDAVFAFTDINPRNLDMSAPSKAGAYQPDNPARPKANHRVGTELCA